MIDVILTATATGCEVGRAEAPDCEAAVLAAKTLYQDVQDAQWRRDQRPDLAGVYHRPCTTVFMDAATGRTLLRTTEAPR